MTYQDLLTTISKQGIKINQPRLNQVYLFAKKAHQDQVRKSGHSFIFHPLFVANVLATWKQTQPVIESALLHDVIEDTKHTQEDIQKLFGPEIAFLVNGVTKVGQVKIKKNLKLTPVENLRKMFVAMAQDIRVILIKLADRYHNLLTLDPLPPAKRKRIALNTLEIYAPLAERLGMGQIKGQLEDLAFPHIYPKQHRWVTALARDHLKQAQKTTQRTISQLKQKLTQAQIKAQIHGRPKHKYSLYQKLLRPEINKDINKIHDLVALRLIAQNKTDCYTCLGLIHSHWEPVPDLSLRDFIAQPKPNGYQSIHTTVFNRQGEMIEIQIRTQEMHQQAEFGPASHSLYSEAKNKGVSQEKLDQGTAFKITPKMDWVKHLAKWQQQINSPQEFAHHLKVDALSQRLYVFTPLGDVFDLPAQSTPIDLAFAVHGQLGFFIQAAKVNQKIATLNHQLKNGDLVEILKSKSPRLPPREWLQFVKTTRARNQIKKALAKSTKSATI